MPMALAFLTGSERLFDNHDETIFRYKGEFVSGLLKRYSVWIGLYVSDAHTDINETGKWTDGSMLDFRNWGDGEPNNSDGAENCTVMYTDGKWNDVACSLCLPFICETDRTCRAEYPSRSRRSAPWRKEWNACPLPWVPLQLLPIDRRVRHEITFSTLPEFTYDPDKGCTFDDIIANDGFILIDAAKARLIVSKLDAATYARFTNRRRHPTSPSMKRSYLDTTRPLSPVAAPTVEHSATKTTRDYTGLVNRRHEEAEFNDVTPEKMKCLVWICGLTSPEDADIRTHAPRRMENNPQITLKELSAEIQQFTNNKYKTKCQAPRKSTFITV
ncbi:lectin C-type domain protein [Ancylostoma duodenale]|uniref:Lectin C-type domain protein n=1 Tax=Ancylostoma duodenale TaxID=51022 RepID=A0A0C2H1R9_9BILA|nr:lectin C-type domain protein [Ancylostoma duodenale]